MCVLARSSTISSEFFFHPRHRVWFPCLLFNTRIWRRIDVFKPRVFLSGFTSILIHPFLMSYLSSTLHTPISPSFFYFHLPSFLPLVLIHSSPLFYPVLFSYFHSISLNFLLPPPPFPSFSFLLTLFLPFHLALPFLLTVSVWSSYQLAS